MTGAATAAITTSIVIVPTLMNVIALSPRGEARWYCRHKNGSRPLIQQWRYQSRARTPRGAESLRDSVPTADGGMLFFGGFVGTPEQKVINLFEPRRRARHGRHARCECCRAPPWASWCLVVSDGSR